MEYEYDVAVSFAGEDRDYVEKVVRILNTIGLRVFYDKYYQVDMWGKDLYVHLHEVYHTKAKYCVMFLSKQYKEKVWPNHERQSAQARAMEQKNEYILPVRLDETVIPGVRPTTGYIQASDYPPEKLAAMIAQKINAEPYEFKEFTRKELPLRYETLRIEGGNQLRGNVRISGRKNSALAVIPAALLAETQSVIRNVPDITHIETNEKILESFGVATKRKENYIIIDPGSLLNCVIPARSRYSFYLAGVLLARFGYAKIGMLHSGWEFGPFPYDLHFKGFRALGAEISKSHNNIEISTHCLKGNTIYLDWPSDSATINIMLAASRAHGTTVIQNAAKDIHVIDIANFLGKMGVPLSGAGTDTIIIHGVDSIEGCSYIIAPDDIEAAFFMAATVATKGEIQLEGIVPAHIDCLIDKFREIGADITVGNQYIKVACHNRPVNVSILPQPHPGFPLEAQPILAAVLATADGISVITELTAPIHTLSLKIVNGLKKMGAQISFEGRNLIIKGVNELHAITEESYDYLGTAGLVVAALGTNGITKINNAQSLQMGFEYFPEKLRELGGNIHIY